MATDEIERDVVAAWSSIPHVAGINNHMGSKATADERVVRAVLSVVLANDSFFLDSRTTSASVVPEIAEKLGVSYLRNDRFIDPDTDPGRVRDRIIQVAERAKERGWAVAIGHVHRSTYEGLVAAIPFLEAEGVRLVHLTDVLAKATTSR